MSKTPQTAVELSEVIRDRWSPRSFDETYELSDQELLAILEAGRWAPSAMNSQPWRFSVAKRGSDLHKKLEAALSGFNQKWAPAASALVVVSVKKTDDGASSKGNFYDAGLSVASMTLQAQALGLHSHQMAGIDAKKMAEILEIPVDFEVAIAVAIGKRDVPEKLEGQALDRELAPRERMALAEIVLHGLP
ncbi:MAG: nitroreductase family protein [Actinomycetales bacterium]|nr:nitroreductase family protein [Actinomycetales bacterium]